MQPNQFYEEGQKAFLDGLRLSQNPYGEDTDTYAYQCWINGYNSHSMPTNMQLLSDMNEEA